MLQGIFDVITSIGEFFSDIGNVIADFFSDVVAFVEQLSLAPQMVLVFFANTPVYFVSGILGLLGVIVFLRIINR